MKRALLLVVVLLCSGCLAIQDRVVEMQLKKVQKFLDEPGVELVQVEGVVWSFRYRWYRNLLVIDGDEALLVDPISAEAARALAAALEQRLPDVRITTVVYSHSHHDHIRGVAALESVLAEDVTIVAHENLLRELTTEPGTHEVVAPTRLVRDDTTLEFANTSVQLLHLPRSHSDSYLAVWLPEQRTLYPPDLVAKRGGLILENDNFLPGVLDAQERLLKLDAKIIVPGHFDLCTNDDLQRVHDMLARMREIVAEELQHEEGYDVTTWDTKSFVRIQRRLRAEFGDVPGFNDAIITNTYYLVIGYVGGF